MSTATAPTTAETLRGEFDERESGGNWAMFWGVLLVAACPMMVPYLRGMWDLEWYGFFPFVFLLVGWLAWSRSDHQFYAPRRLSKLAIAVGIFCVVLAILFTSPWFGSIGFVLIAGALLHSLRGPNDRSLTVLALPLLLLVRLPLGYDQLLVIKLQNFTSQMASVVLDLLGIPHAVMNNIVQLTTRELFVAEACSGIQSVFTLMFVSLAIIAINRRRIWLSPFYIAAAIFLALFANVFRVSTVAIGEVWGDIDLATGAPHEIVGYIALAFASLLLLSFDQLMISIFHETETEQSAGDSNPFLRFWNFCVHTNEIEIFDDEDDVQESSPADRTATSSGGLLVIRYATLGLAALVGIAAIASVAQMSRPSTIPATTDDVVFSPSPQMFDGMRFSVISLGEHSVSRGNDDPRLGSNADIWECNVGDLSSNVVLSQTYRRWHELCICYGNRDWLLLNREVVDATTSFDRENVVKEVESEGDEDPIAFARFKQENGQRGYLFYSAVDRVGALVSPPPLPGTLGNRFQDWFYDEDEFVRTSGLMMFQMWIATPKKIDMDTLSAIRNDFIEMRRRLVTTIRTSSPTPENDLQN